MHFWETVKEHKVLVGVIVAGALIYILVFGSSSSSSTASTVAASTDSSAAANAYANTLAQIQGQTQLASINAGVGSQQIAGAVTQAQLQAGVADNANTLAAQVAEFESSIAGNVQTNHDTLSAGVATTQSNNQLAATVSNNNTAAANQKTLADALVTENSNQSAVMQSYIHTLPEIIGAQSAGAIGVAQANQPAPCQSFLFGLFSSC